MRGAKPASSFAHGGIAYLLRTFSQRDAIEKRQITLDMINWNVKTLFSSVSRHKRSTTSREIEGQELPFLEFRAKHPGQNASVTSRISKCFPLISAVCGQGNILGTGQVQRLVGSFGRRCNPGLSINTKFTIGLGGRRRNP